MKNGWRALPLALLILTVLVMVGLAPRLYQRTQLAAGQDSARDAAPEVQVSLPHKEPDGGLTLPASMQPIEDTVILSRTAGYVKRRLVDIGDHVRKGQLLAEIESPEVDSQEYQAQAQTRQTSATVRQAMADAERLRAGVLQSVAQRSSGVAAVKHAQAAALSLRAQLIASQRTLDARRSDVANLKTQMGLAERQWQRYQKLVVQGFVTQEQGDQVQSAFQSAKSAYEAAVGTAETAAANVDAAQKNLEASQSDVDAARAALRADDESVQAATASLRSGQEIISVNQFNVQASQANQDRYHTLTGFERVVAPFDGVITTRSIDTGFLINPTSTTYEKTGLFEEARTDAMLIDIQVPQSYVAYVRDGLQADILVREFPGETFKGTVLRVSGGLDNASRTIHTQVRVPNAGGRLLPGMYAQVHFAPISTRPILRVPGTALVINADGTRVATVDANDRVHFVDVKLGRDYGADTEVLAGLKGTERVATNPSDELLEGLKVVPHK